jgi:hypothetical protein
LWVVVVLPKREKTYYSYVENRRRDSFLFPPEGIEVKLLSAIFLAIKLKTLIKMSAWSLYTFISVIGSIIFVLASPWSVCTKDIRF